MGRDGPPLPLSAGGIPLYSGKALSGLLGHIRHGEAAPGETVAFPHTGGTPALFADAAWLGDLIAAG